MKTFIVTDRQILYDGSQLTPHWIYNQFDIIGDAIVAFTGSCRVDLNKMVDIEDIKRESAIFSPIMLHFIAEFFYGDLEKTVYRQRLLIVIAKEVIENRIRGKITRKGDDLYVIRENSLKKLSVSIATASVNSTLIHAGFNIKTEGTPVPTIGLEELEVDPLSFAQEVLERYTQEIQDIWIARCKVRPVH